MSEKADTPKRHQRDKLLIAAVTGAVAVLVAVALSIGYAVSVMGGYHRYIQDLGDSLLYARTNDTLEITVDNETSPAYIDDAEWLYKRIERAGMGSPLSELPEGESFAFSFGDGSTLQLFPTTIDEPDGTQAEGAIVCYTRSDGHKFSYDTDLLVYERIEEHCAS